MPCLPRPRAENTDKMKIYNTLTGRKGELKEKMLGVYVCGPTVYDEPHIGHARSAYIFDVIVRYLRFRGFKVKFLRNVTDIDDKIIDKARHEPGEGDLRTKTRKVAGKYLKKYREDMKLLSVGKPDMEPKATETIGDMIKFIKKLMKKDYAYESSGNVYFNVRKFKHYGKLSGQSLDEMEEGARVTLDKNKKDPLDFALWKTSKKDEPYWRSPWGNGRPGWHIECSVMSTKFLGKNFLIHGGGLDLVFPHHENEIAQTVCAGKKSAKYWLHNGLLTINGQKMAKSLGNFITISDFCAGHKDPDLLKLLFLSSHYRHPVDYTENKITEMARMKERLMIFFEKARSKRRLFAVAERKSNSKRVKKKEIKKLKNEFVRAMDDDFNTPKALAAIFELVTVGNTAVSEGDVKSAGDAVHVITEFSGVLGLGLIRAAKADSDITGEIEILIKKRSIARKNRDFEKADKIRDTLAGRGIVLEDTKEGTRWRKKI